MQISDMPAAQTCYHWPAHHQIHMIERIALIYGKYLFPSIIASIASILLSSCSIGQNMRPKNSISEPLFYDSSYAAIGIALNKWESSDSKIDSSSFEFSPIWSLQIPINHWCSYNGIPVNFNFLLSGQQYTDAKLIQGKAHIVMSGGIEGFSYQTNEGVSLPGSLRLNGKIITSDKVFMFGSAGSYFYDVTRLDALTLNEVLGLGIQATHQLAITASQEHELFSLRKHYVAKRYGVRYVTGETSSSANLACVFYITQHHKIGATARLLIKNLEPGLDDAYAGKFDYVYIF